MAQNIVPNATPGKFASWTVAATGSATSPVGTYSATSGPESTPGLTLSATGTSGGVEATYTVASVPGDAAVMHVSVNLKASSATPDCTPIQVVFLNSAGQTIVTATPFANAAAVTSNTQYDASIAVPYGAASAEVIVGYLNWSSTGGYTTVMAAPAVYFL